MEAARRRAWGELAAVAFTVGAYLIFENILRLKLPFLIPCVILWSAYVVLRLVRDPESRARWGLGTGGSGPAAREALLVLAVGAVALVGYRVLRGWQPLPPGALLILAVYPVWALLQQFVLQGLVASNLERLGASWWVILPAAAALFGLAHAPDWPLAGLCAGAGLLWTAVFLRTRNLYPLALCHAWLGTLAFYWILERNPWLEMMPGSVH